MVLQGIQTNIAKKPYIFVCEFSGGRGGGGGGAGPFYYALVKRAGCVTFLVFLMSCDCCRSLPLPHGAVGWSSVCDCGISWS